MPTIKKALIAVINGGFYKSRKFLSCFGHLDLPDRRGSLTQPVEVLHPVDVVKCPPDVKHWHGASANSRFAHLAAGTNPDKPAVMWTDKIFSNDEYNKLPKE